MGLQVMSPEAFLTGYPAVSRDMPEHALRRVVHVYDQDTVIDGDLNLDEAEEDGTNGASIYLKDLTVKGNLINRSMEGGRALVVEGKFTADNILASGAFIRLGETILKGAAFAHYHLGSLHGKSLKALMLITGGHDTWFDKQDVELSFEGSGGMESVHVDGVHIHSSTSSWPDRVVRNFVNGPMAEFFKGTPWFRFWAGTDDNWTEYKGVAPSDYPDLEIDSGVMDWLGWVRHETEADEPAAPASFRAFVDLAKHHIVAPIEGDNDHASG